MEPHPLATQYASHCDMSLMSYQRYVNGSHSNSVQSHMILTPSGVWGQCVWGGSDVPPPAEAGGLYTAVYGQGAWQEGDHPRQAARLVRQGKRSLSSVCVCVCVCVCQGRRSLSGVRVHVVMLFVLYLSVGVPSPWVTV